MKPDRHMLLPALNHDPAGRPLCRWCGGPVAKPRKTFCSTVCVDEYLVRSSPGAAARAVLARDEGVCALCGIDTVAYQRAWWRVGWKATRDMQKRHRLTGRGRWWDVDHIVPVVHGGGSCGIDNLRTLCVWCHRAETAALAKRLAGSRHA